MSKRKSTTRGKRTVAQVVATASRQARQQQLANDNQKASINRLLAAMRGGDEEAAAHAMEITTLNVTLAHTQEKLEAALEECRALRHAVGNQLPGDQPREDEEECEMGRRKDAFMAGFEAGETVDDRDQAWKDFKAAEAEEESEDAGTED